MGELAWVNGQSGYQQTLYFSLSSLCLLHIRSSVKERNESLRFLYYVVIVVGTHEVVRSVSGSQQLKATDNHCASRRSP